MSEITITIKGNKSRIGTLLISKAIHTLSKSLKYDIDINFLNEIEKAVTFKPCLDLTPENSEPRAKIILNIV